MASRLGGPLSGGGLQRQLLYCRDRLCARELGLFLYRPEDGGIARLITTSTARPALDWEAAPQPVAEVFATGADAICANDAGCSRRLFGPEANWPGLFFVSIPLQGDVQGLLALAAADPPRPGLSVERMRDLGEVLLAAARHTLEYERGSSHYAHRGEVLNFSDSIYASWHEKEGWRYHAVNGLTQLGHRKKDIDLSSPADNPMHPEDWRTASSAFDRAVEQGKGYQHEYRIRSRSGEYRWYRGEAKVTARNESGGARDLIAISRNVTAMHQAAKRAVEKASLEKWLVAKSNAIFNCNDFESMNRVLQEVGSYLGVERCTVRVVDPETLFCNLVAEWYKPGRQAIARLYPDMTSRTGIGWIERFINLGQAYVVNSFTTDVPDEKLVDYHRSIDVEASITQPMLHGEQLTGYLAILSEKPRHWTANDIRVSKVIADTVHLTILRNRLVDELRATEDRFQVAMEVSTYGLWDHDEVNGTMYYSPHFYEKLGYPRIDTPIPIRGMLDYIHPDDHKLLLKQAEQEKIATENDVRLELRHRKADGGDVWLLARGKVVQRDEEGRPLRVVGVNMDLSEQKRIEAELRRAREMAEEANRSKSEFLERMSHEIRTPMNAITGMSYLALQTPLDPDQRAYLQDMEDAATSLLHIIDDILDFSRIEAGELKIVSESFDLKQELGRISKLMRVRAGQARNHMSCRIDPDVPLQLVGDKHRLGQILTNLLANAVKFTSNGRIDLSVSCIDYDERLNLVNLSFSVQDTGIGLTGKQIATLFEPFVQGEQSTARKYGGTGLGLSICKHLVELMGGSIRCSSSPEQGTTFVFSLTFKQQAATSSPKPEKGRGRQAMEIVSDFPRHVLLVEDNAVNQRVAQGILRKLSIEVTTAVNGAEAIAMLEKAEPDTFDAVLMDIEMPVLDGIAASRAIRRQPRFRGLPIIAMTAHAMRGDRERCLAAGMDDYLPKPINPEQLREVLTQNWPDGTVGARDEKAPVAG